jgi:hypothetical protein
MLITLLVLLASLVVLLAVPIDVVFAVRRGEKFRGRVTIGWLFGVVRVPLRPGRARSKPKKPKPAPARRVRRGGRKVTVMLRSEAFFAHVMRFLLRLAARIHIRRLRLHLRLGLDDPADTGRLWGMVGPLAWAAPVPAGTDLAIEPEFTGASFRVDGEGAVRIVPIGLLATLIGFALSPVTWRALRASGTSR